MDDLRQALGPLSIALLRLSQDAVGDLTRFGLKNIGALYAIPRAALCARFDARSALGRARADMVLRRLDEALGRIEEPISPILPMPVLRLTDAFPEPVFDTAVIAHALARLLERLAPMLERMGLGARRLCLAVFRTDGSALHLDAATSAPSRDAVHWARLYGDKLEAIEAPFGVDMVALHVVVAEPLLPTQEVLAQRREKRSRQNRLDQVIDRIANRFGARQVLRSMQIESHLPEQRDRHASALQGGAARSVHKPPVTAPRPFRLFDNPEAIDVMAAVPDGPPMRFRWRRKLHAVHRAQGPERIAPQWWQDSTARLRDYYQVENADGVRFWLYREGSYEDAGESVPPRWFMHGLFV
jgi:protein ImuB